MLASLTMHYGWWLLALVLIGVELMAPGFFMLWIGIAAAALGVVLIFVPQMSFGMQAVVFAVFAVISCYLYWHFVRHAMHERSDQPNLNRRAEQYIGRRFVLETAIVNGQGKARVGDTLWLAEGPDLPSGTPIEVVGVDGSTLKVKAAV